MMFWSLRVFCLPLLLLIPGLSLADNSWEKNRLIPLDKLTVGPWDNFEAAVASDDNTIYYTRDQNRIPNILRQDLRANTTTVLIGKKGDAKEPALDPAGSRLAVTFYGDDAQGDVCLYPLPDGPMNCITSAATVDKSPFWIDRRHLGYLSRKTEATAWRVVIYDLQEKSQKTILSGLISNPRATADGHYILLSEAQRDGSTRLQAWDRVNAKLLTPPRFDLSGITGSAVVSNDGKFLYFNQYLNDTNGDQTIDGNDNSVAFRVPFEKWLHSTAPLLPEQLTSVAKNCKFPSLSTHYLYLTCAFEGSLDIYRLPLTGSVPSAWNVKQLWEAHRTARSYEARLLILNTLRYRYHRNGIDMLERLLSNHLEIGELTAATYYVQQLQTRYQQKNNLPAVHFYHALGALFHVRASKQRVPVGVVTNRFKRIVAETRKKIHAQAFSPNLTTLMDAWFDYELEHETQALTRLKQYDLASNGLLPLERMLAFDLYRRLLETTNPQRLLRIYPLMFNAASLPLDARIYYGFNYLKLLSRLEKDNNQRLKTVTEQIASIHQPKLIELFRGEAAALKLIESKDQKIRNRYFQALSKRLKKDRGDPLLRKAMHVRAMQNLGEAEEFQYLELFSRNWLLTTKTSEMEFVNVAEQFAVITMDKAYGMLSQGQLAKAYSTFYSAIRQTNDLEAHYQFLTLGLDPKLHKRENLNRSYEILEKQGIVGANLPYVKALRRLLETDQNNPSAWAAALKKAQALLQPMRARGLNPAMRDLLLGYIYHQQLRASQVGYHYDKTLFQKAHYHYIMALDLGRDNSRITASVWENLAALHFEVRNFALSVDFFKRRMQLPFVTVETQALTELAFARALYANNQANPALQEAKKALQLAHKSKTLDDTPFIEKKAFYALQAKAYPEAIAAWQSLLNQPAALEKANRAKALLGYSYALMKTGKTEQARTQLQSLIKLSQTLQPQPADNNRLIASRPERFQLLAWGLLATMADTPQQRIQYRNERIRLLQKMAGKNSAFAWKEASRLSLLAKDYQHLAADQEIAGQYSPMAKSMGQALKAASAWVKETDDQLGPVIYHTLINYLTLGITHPDSFSGSQQDRLKNQYQRTVDEFRKLKWRPPIDIARQAKLEILWEAYQSRVMGKNTATLPQRLHQMINSSETNRLQSEKPEALKALRDLEHTLSTLQ